MTADEIRAAFPAWSRVMCYDATYGKPTVEWLLRKFYPWWKARRWEGNLDKWTRKNDCDNFGRAFAVAAQDAHADTNQADEGLAVGEFCYIGSSHVQGPHHIVAAFTDEGLIFIEPQTGQRLALTPAEIQTCFHAAF